MIPGRVTAEELVVAFAAEPLGAAILPMLKIGSQKRGCGSRDRMPKKKSFSTGPLKKPLTGCLARSESNIAKHAPGA
jgi:hypothetical protein